MSSSQSLAKILDQYRVRKSLGLPLCCSTTKKQGKKPAKKRHKKANAPKRHATPKRAGRPSARAHFIHSQMAKGRTEKQAAAAWRLVHRRKAK